MKVLFIADIVGKPGRAGLHRVMPELRRLHSPDLVIANGENSAGGLGITEKTAKDIFATGVDVITTGNHVYRHREAYPFLDRSGRVIRPANYMSSNPGRGHTIVDTGGIRVCVINLSGQVSLRAARSPFTEVDALLDRLAGDADAFVVDFHAEVTSEKVAMGWHLDGRVAAVLGTHTHVPTADARVLPRGTAFISDVGMTGSRASVLGVRWEQALESFRTQLPIRFETASEDVWVNAAVVTVD
ncbi:MAG TPA: TIGR00282 family metallophosphoesterase, partial [Solirubrobacterales bacterium]|nr:TIGR00282 family metallophosphoesterase [Solirubrobacterales bacterium]